MTRRGHRSPNDRTPPKGPSRARGGEVAPVVVTPARHLLVAVFLAVLVAAGYVNALQNNFVWDDTKQILQNPYIRQGAPWPQLFSSDVWAFTHPRGPAVNNYYRPLQMLTYLVTARLCGFSAAAFHGLSLVSHLVATLLAYLVVYQLTRCLPLAAAAAAIFALHPIHTEAVTWISALPELGCAVFFMLALYLFLLATHPPGGAAEEPETRLRKPWLWISSWVCFALALLWKEMAVTLPIVIGLHLVLLNAERLPSMARLRRALRLTLPYWAVLAAYVPLRYHALGFVYVSQRNWVLPAGGYVLTAAELMAEYWWKLVIPLHLNAYHVFNPVRSLAEPRFLGASLFLLAAAVGFGYGFRRAPLATFAGSWVFLTLVPVLNLRGVGRNVFAERYLYIPSVGFCLLLVWLASKGLGMLQVRHRTWVGAGALALVLALCLVQTVRRNNDWRDQFTFFSRTLEASPESPDMQNAVAELLRSEKGEPERAEHHYERAVALAEAQRPPEWDQIDSAYIGLALIYAERREFDKALNALDKAQAADPKDSAVQSARGGVLLQQGRWQEAQTILRKVLQTDPDDANALNGLAFIAWQYEQRYEQAIDYFQRALQVQASSDSLSSSVHNSLGALYCELGRCSEGLAHFQRAVELTPDDPEYHTNLGNALGATGRLNEARAELERALSLAPNYPPARSGLQNLEQAERRAR